MLVLQRLRLELAASWPEPGGAQSAAWSIGACSGGGCVWLHSSVVELALSPLERLRLAGGSGDSSSSSSSGGGGEVDIEVMQSADVLSFTLCLLRWVLLREAAAPLGLLLPAMAQGLARRDLLPLQASAQRLERHLQQQQLLELELEQPDEQQQQQQQHEVGGVDEPAPTSALGSLLAVQRLQQGLECVLELIYL